MTDWPDYQLIDFGEGRKLERFGDLLVDRPAPAAMHADKLNPGEWKRAVARYSGDRVGDGKWRLAEGLRPSEHAIAVPLAGGRSFCMALELSPAGQVGLFAEQFGNWGWISGKCGGARAGGAPPSPSPSPRRGGGSHATLRVLNLFGYTGGSTLAAAAAGAEVTHVDASKPSVAIARRNAELSGLADAPIRWIVEDAVRYCQREVKRGNRYDAVILDPPSYGHGPKGEEWKLTRDLPRLLELIAELTQPAPKLLLASCHTPGVGPAELGAYLADGVFGSCSQPANTNRLSLVDTSGRRLESGVVARWPG